MVRLVFLALIIVGLVTVMAWAGYHVRLVRAPENIPAAYGEGPPNAVREATKFKATFSPSELFTDSNGMVKATNLDFRPVQATIHTTGSATHVLAAGEVFAVTAAPIHITARQNALELANPRTGKAITWSLPTSARVELNAPNRKDSQKIAYVDRGITWEWLARATGAKLQGRVMAPKGVQVYSFGYTLAEGSTPLTEAPDGSLMGDGFHVEPVTVIDARGNTYAAGGYTVTPTQISFTFDDSVIPHPAGYPYIVDPTTNFDIDDGNNDVGTEKIGTTYPPNGDGGTQVSVTSTAIGPNKSFDGANYTNNAAILSWDTSSLPDDAIITGATLTLNVTAKNDTDERGVVVEWYDVQPPFSIADHVDNQATEDIAATVLIDDLSVAVDDIELNTDANTVDPQAFTTLRLSISGGAPSSGSTNNVTFETLEAAGTDEPRLTLTYIDPLELTTPAIEEVLAYSGVYESGDMLFLLHYNIGTDALASLPEEPARDTYRALLADGADVLQSPAIVSTSENQLRGYGHGLVAFYFTADQVTDQSLGFGSPGVYDVTLEAVDYSATVTANTTTISFRASEALLNDLITLAQHYESTWSIDVLSNNRLTATGQDYFETVWPFLCDALPDFCSLTQAELDTGKGTFGTTTKDNLDAFWDGVDPAINPKTQLGTLAGLFGMGQSEFTLALILIATIAACFYFIPRGIPGQWVIACGCFSIVFAALIGLVIMEIGLFMGLIGVALVVWALMARRAGG